jgi:large subunit ribosomal protein L21
MYAVFVTGGKQYRAAPGETLRVERLAVEPGETVDFDQVLLVGAEEGVVQVGTPVLAGGRVSARVKSHGRGDKVRIVKFKRRKHHLKRQGHRQDYTEIEVTGIHAG